MKKTVTDLCTTTSDLEKTQKKGEKAQMMMGNLMDLKKRVMGSVDKAPSPSS